MKPLLVLAIPLLLACASVSVDQEGKDFRVFGKAEAKEVCTENDTGKVCETSATGEGLTENAVEAIKSLFETIVKVPGAVARGAGGVLP